MRMQRPLAALGIAVAMAAWIALATPAAAQRPDKNAKLAAEAPETRFIPLLAAPDVQADLKLPRETVDKIKTLLSQREDAIRNSVRQGGTGREKAERTQAAAAEIDGKIAALIDAAQRGRLRQIYLQARGPDALVEPEIAAALKIEPQQREGLSKVTQEMALAKGQYARELLGQVNFTDKAEAKARKEFLPKSLAVLTAEQRKTWDSLTGPPFAGEVPLSALVLSGRRPSPARKEK
jgi:hypothetical protein